MVACFVSTSAAEEAEFGAASWKEPEVTLVFFLVNIFSSEPRDFLSSLTTSCFSGSPGFGACYFAEAMMYLAAPSFWSSSGSSSRCLVRYSTFSSVDFVLVKKPKLPFRFGLKVAEARGSTSCSVSSSRSASSSSAYRPPGLASLSNSRTRDSFRSPWSTGSGSGAL